MLWTWIGLIVIALGGLLWSAKNQRKNANAQTIALISLVLILVGAGGILKEQGMLGSNPEVNRVIRNETKFAEAKAKVMAKFLSEKYPGAKVVFLIDNQLDSNSMNKAALAAFKKELTGMTIEADEIYEIPKVSADPEQPMMMDDMYNADKFNAIFERCKDANLIINFTNLPYDPREIAKFTLWTMKDGPNLVLFTGEVSMMKSAIKAGKIVLGTAMGTKSIDPKQACPSDAQEAFDLRYILVHPGNVDQVAEDNPNIFIPM